MLDRSVDTYDRWHRAKAEGDDIPQPTAPWHLMARKHLPDVRGLAVLEIGCGRGGFARFLAEQGAQVTAADFSPAAVEFAAGLLAPPSRALVADVQAIPFPDKSFDLVVSLETLEHVTDPALGLRELVRVTKRGGRIIVTTPNYFGLMGLSRIAYRLLGRRFQESGQPLNKPLFLWRRVRALKRLGCRVEAVDGGDQRILIPGIGAFRLRFLERPHRLMKWFGLRSLTAATRL